MTGIQRIGDAFAAAKPIKIMTHVIGGYPDMETCEKLVVTMAQHGVDLIEVQLPFSDPSADGPVIVQANHRALQAGITTEKVLGMLEKVRKRISVPLLIMSYINPLFAYGIEKIITHAEEIGIDGFIIPDCPIEETEFDIPGLCNDRQLAFIPLIAPTTTPDRMELLAGQSLSPFVYAVLRMGVTGRKTELDHETEKYLHAIKQNTNRFVAAGFGIAEKSQLHALVGHADCGVIGSALLRLVNAAIDQKREPVNDVKQFLEELAA